MPEKIARYKKVVLIQPVHDLLGHIWNCPNHLAKLGSVGEKWWVFTLFHFSTTLKSAQT
jgi:hypothetical protein